jgi:hypothetical protein
MVDCFVWCTTTITQDWGLSMKQASMGNKLDGHISLQCRSLPSIEIKNWING